MKKIKLITGLSALSILGVSTLPLTSCKKQPIEQFTVHFETNGGSSIADVKVNKGQKVTKPADPTKDGFVFNGWYYDPDITKTYDFDSKVESNLVIYAGWRNTGVAQVTKQEWEAAFDAISNPDIWNCTCNFVTQRISGGIPGSETKDTWAMAQQKMSKINCLSHRHFWKKRFF